MTKLLEDALKGNTASLFEITLAIQKHKLEISDEQAIVFNQLTKKDKAYYWMKYLESCVYAFGAQKVGQDPGKYDIITKELLAKENNSVHSWAVNLLFVMDADKVFGQNLSITDRALFNKALETAKRTLNPFVLHNESKRYRPVDPNNINFEAQTKYLELITPIYQFLPDSFRKEDQDSISLIISAVSKTDDVPIALFNALGNFYEQNDDKANAKIWFNKASQGNVQTTQNWLDMLSTQKSKDIENTLKTFINKLNGHYDELRDRLPDLDFLEGEKNIIAAIKKELNHVKDYIVDLHTIADRKPKFLTETNEKLISALLAAQDKLNQHIQQREKIVDNMLLLNTTKMENEKLNENYDRVSILLNATCQQLNTLRGKYQQAVDTNLTLKKQIDSLQQEPAPAELKTSTPTTSAKSEKPTEKAAQEQSSSIASNFFRMKK